jgi:preprotein translocase subunit SecD
MRRPLVLSLIGIVVVAVGALGLTLGSGKHPKLGLDLQGGVSVVLKPDHPVSSGVLGQAQSIISRRVNGLGISEPNITRQGGTILVELAGVRDPDTALKLVGQTAELLFRPVLQALPPQGPTPATTTTTPGASTTTAPGSSTTAPAGSTSTTKAGALGGPTSPPGTTLSTELASFTSQATPTTTGSPATTASPAQVPAAPTPVSPDQTGNLPSSPPAQANDPAQTVVLPELDSAGNVVARYLLGPAELTGRIVSTAIAQPPTIGGNWAVEINFTDSGSAAWDSMAAKYVQKQIAIVLDGVVKSAPTIQTSHFNGRAQITGSFTQHQAQDLALVLRYGALPVQLSAESIQEVSATIGKDSLHAGVVAGILGLALVMLYMIFYYRALGIVVVVGLGVSAMLLWSIISLVGTVLTLAGVTGIIVSIGVTVDSYVVYFERLKDELRAGKTVRSSVDRGFSRAYRTILAADFVSFCAAAILWVLAIGSVRGFAFFLGLSTILDVVTAYLFTRPVVTMLGRNRIFTEARFLGVARGLAASPTGGVV